MVTLMQKVKDKEWGYSIIVMELKCLLENGVRINCTEQLKSSIISFLIIQNAPCWDGINMARAKVLRHSNLNIQKYITATVIKSK